MVKAVSSRILINAGHLLENIVFVSLRRQKLEIHYFKTSNGLEIDFLTLNQQRELSLIQVCDSLYDEKTRKRELKALQIAMKELKVKNALIITRDEIDEIQLEEGLIKVTPIWQYLYERQIK